MPVHTGRLLLTPEDPHRVPDVPRLRTALGAAGLLGAPLPGRDHAFLVGERFLALFTFAGCSVQIELAPPAEGDGPFCHICFMGPFASPTLLQGRNTRPPRCRACRAPLKEWRARLSAVERHSDVPLACPTCGAARPPWDWDWKGNAGFGRFFISVEEVFPGEATPAPSLIELLTRETGAAWRHFYVQDV
jgi:hypothetical protein